MLAASPDVAGAARPRRLRGAAAALAVAGGLVLGGAPPAAAHSELVGLRPANASTHPALPARVMLEFSGAVGEVLRLQVRGPDGRERAGRARVVSGAPRVTAALRGADTPGLYRGAWVVDSADGHVQAGSFGFRVAPPGPRAAAGVASPQWRRAVLSVVSSLLSSSSPAAAEAAASR